VDNFTDCIKEIENNLDIQERIEEVLSVIEREQERLSIIINSITHDYIGKEYFIYTMASSKISVEYMRSILTNTEANYKFSDIVVKTNTDPLEKSFKERVRRNEQ